MIYVGIDVAKDKHDCCILGSDGEILFSSKEEGTLAVSEKKRDLRQCTESSLALEAAAMTAGTVTVSYSPGKKRRLEPQSRGVMRICGAPPSR